MTAPWSHDRYDAIVAGARVAGASTAMLMARAGMRVLVVDPVPAGRDTLSTHALMRGGVLQLHRWGVLGRIREAGTPLIATTTFHYGDEEIAIPIKPKDGVDGLYAPRRTVLDHALVDAALEAGAEVVHGWAVSGLLSDRLGRVTGATITSADGRSIEVGADLVVGADGLNSKVARLVGAPVDYEVPHATACLYGYWPRLDLDGYHWHYALGAGAGVIPTNDDLACVFVSVRPERFRAERREGLPGLFRQAVTSSFPALAARLERTGHEPKLRAFAGSTTRLRRATGSGWALVGDAGYFKDPLTAHGITDALRDAELLARAAAIGTREALSAYQRTRDQLSKGLMRVTSRIASLHWSLEEVKELHLQLSREMASEMELIRNWNELKSAA